jgi:aryl-alcohol dehydrogenase-like predicted oxidoreductase
METRTLGRTGLKVSVLCLGTMQFGWTAGEDLSYQILDAAWQAGINFIDTADVYSKWIPGNPGGVSETILGSWQRRSAIPRERLILATKVRGQMGSGPDSEGLGRAHILKAVEDSLRRLQTDYIDLYQAHSFDAGVPIDETLRAFDDLTRQGKVRYIGCSNYPAWRLMQALWASDALGLARYDSLQPHYNLVHRAEFERELSEVCREYELGVIPYSPLAAGFLTGKYRSDSVVESARSGRAQRYFTDRNWKLIDHLEQTGRELGGRSVSQVALAWLLADPLITSPIIGPRTLQQLDDNLGAASLQLSAEHKQALDELSRWEE